MATHYPSYTYHLCVSEISQHTGAVIFPESRKQSGRNKSPFSEDGNDPNVNPFRMPPDNDIFQRRDQERQKKKQVGLHLLKNFHPHDISFIALLWLICLYTSAKPGLYFEQCRELALVLAGAFNQNLNLVLSRKFRPIIYITRIFSSTT